MGDRGRQVKNEDERERKGMECRGGIEGRDARPGLRGAGRKEGGGKGEWMGAIKRPFGKEKGYDGRVTGKDYLVHGE